jgi:hypothetical protein
MSGGLGPWSRGALRPRAWRSHAGVAAGGVVPSRRVGPGVLPPEKFRNFTAKS